MRLKGILFIITYVILFGLPLQSKSLHWNKGRGYVPFQFATNDGIFIDNPTDTLRYDYFSLPYITKDFSLNFRAKNINGNILKKYSYLTSAGKKINVVNPHWGFFITCENDTVIFSVKGNEIQTSTETLPSLDISCYTLSNSTKHAVSLTEKVNPYDGDNIWSVVVTNDILTLLVGDKNLNPVFELKQALSPSGFGFFAGWGDKILISDIKAEFDEVSETASSKNLIEEINDYIGQSEDPMEGYWTLFDRELEESLLKLGGQYTFVCIKEGEGYSFLYIDGATVNSQKWNIGDKKIILTPTPFPDIFDVEWIDSMKLSLNRDIKAQKGDGDTLSIQFPYQSSKVRLRKLPSLP